MMTNRTLDLINELLEANTKDVQFQGAIKEIEKEMRGYSFDDKAIKEKSRSLREKVEKAELKLAKSWILKSPTLIETLENNRCKQCESLRCCCVAKQQAKSGKNICVD